MPQQQNPERGPGGTPAGPERPRTHGHRTATPDVPHVPRQRHGTPSRPPANATPPQGRPATARPTPPGGVPSSGPSPSGPGRPPTRVMPGPGTPEPPPADVRTNRAGHSRQDDGRGGFGAPPGRVDARDNAGRGGSAGSNSGGGATTKQEKSTSELQFNRVVAGAGAAVLTAVLGSFLGAVGTILGAALGSIITTVATTFFQRSIDITRAQVTDKSQKLRERRGPAARNKGAAAWQAAAADGGSGVAGPDGQETVLIDPTAAGAAASPSGSRWRLRKMSRKSILVSVCVAVLAFGLAMFLVTGIEWVKGSTITGGGSGTSIGHVVGGTPAEQPKNDDQSGTTTSTSESATSTSESDSEQPGQQQPTGTSENDGNNSDSSTATSNPLGGLNDIVPTQGNESGQLQSGQDGTGNSGGGANSSN